MPKLHKLTVAFKVVNRHSLPEILTKGLEPKTPAFQVTRKGYKEIGNGVFASKDHPLMYVGYGKSTPEGKHDWHGDVVLQINQWEWYLQEEGFQVGQMPEYYSLKPIPPDNIALVYCRESQYKKNKRLIPKGWLGILVPVPDEIMVLGNDIRFFEYLEKLKKT